jgi:ABC-type nitrate/sulfonate/bicarbonate transport system substrate-binding protein
MMAGIYVIGEMSTASYAVALQNGQRDYKVLAGLATNRGTDEAIGTTMLFTLAGSDILSPQDLIGKRVGVPDLQSSTTSMFLSFLKSRYGIAPEQLTLVDKSNTILMMLLKNGEIDATVLGQNVGPQAYYDSDLRLVWNLDTEFAQEYGASCFPTVLVVNSDFYSANSAAVQEVYELLIESNEYAEAHLAELAQAYSTEFSGLSVDFYLNIHQHHSMASFARMDARNQACIMAVFEIQQENGVITDIPRPARYS